MSLMNRDKNSNASASVALNDALAVTANTVIDQIAHDNDELPQLVVVLLIDVSTSHENAHAKAISFLMTWVQTNAGVSV
jgi:mannitol/fructose-specific phosphotransferase system IIA component (Ntr-type)